MASPTVLIFSAWSSGMVISNSSSSSITSSTISRESAPTSSWKEVWRVTCSLLTPRFSQTISITRSSTEGTTDSSQKVARWCAGGEFETRGFREAAHHPGYLHEGCPASKRDPGGPARLPGPLRRRKLQLYGRRGEKGRAASDLPARLSGTVAPP